MIGVSSQTWNPFGDEGSAKDEGVRPIPDGLDPRSFWDKCKADFEYYAEHCLRIRVKNVESGRNEMIPFILNS